MNENLSSTESKRPPEGTTLLNVCIIPPAEVGNNYVDISQALGSKATLFTLGPSETGPSKFAHMTVYMARFPDESIPEFIEKVKASLQGQNSFICRHIGYFMTAGRYFEASYEKTPEFMDLHRKIIAAGKDMRANPGQPYEEGYFTPYTDEQRKNAEETGYDLADDLYRPHVTITRYVENQVPSEQPTPNDTDLSFDLHTVAVYKADDNGAVYEELARFNIP